MPVQLGPFACRGELTFLIEPYSFMIDQVAHDNLPLASRAASRVPREAYPPCLALEGIA